MPKLTRTMVEGLKAPEKGDTWVWDTDVEGFGVRVQASGRKVYVIRYRVKDAKRTQRKQVIARCSDMAPDKARELARREFAKVAEGLDPIAARRVAKEAPTIKEMYDRFMAEHARPFKKKRSVEHDESRFRVHILPAMANMRVADVTRTDILAFHGKLSHTPATANQCLAILSKAFNLAEDWEWRERNSNPCSRVKKYQLPERELILTAAQIKTLHVTLLALAEDGSVSKPFADLILLLMLTGCRLREVMHARREWVDMERCLLVLPDSKVGQRKISLSPVCMAIIKSMPAGQEWLVPGKSGSKPMDAPYKAWSLLKARAELPDALRLHDLRHTAGSLGHMAGLSQKQIADMLGHKQLSTTERYLHGAVGDKAVVAEKIGNVIAGAWGNAA